MFYTGVLSAVLPTTSFVSRETALPNHPSTLYSYGSFWKACGNTTGTRNWRRSTSHGYPPNAK
jgi:hypothetical protein